MGRREDIEEQLNKDYELLKNLEDKLRTEIDPRLELRWTEDINKVKQQIRQREEELKSLSASSVPNQNARDIKNSDKEKETSTVNMTFNAPVYGVAGNIHGNQNVHASEQKQSLAEEERQEAQTVLKKKVIIEPNPIYPPLSEIPVTGDEASEVGADYTKLRDFLERREFGKADLETARKILWVAKREQEGWLDLEDIENFPRQDLLAINQLWLVASEGKFGFSVQKQIWVNLGGQPGQYNLSVFNRFIKKVKWAENRIVLDQRAAKGHLPVGVFVKVSDDVRINQKWWVEIDKIARIESEEIEREKKRIRSAKRHFEKAEGEHMEQSLQQEMVYRWGWSWVRRGGSRFAVAAMRYLSLLSRDDL